jgi:ubiquinone/menaquinone biosynthesis C-methylase UbiE
MTEPPSQLLVRGLFRVWSHVYDRPVFQWTLYSRVHRRLFAKAERLAPARILDVGCGTGELLVAAARRWPGAALFGVDLSPAMLAKARGKNFGRAVELGQGSVYELPFEAGAFDLVFNTISSHFYLDGARAFAEMARVLEKGGTLLQASLTTGPLAYLPGQGGRSISVPGAVYRGPAEQRRLLRDAGFDVVESRFILPGIWLYQGVKR